MTLPISFAICNIRDVEVLKKVLRILLKAGANINGEDKNGDTPIIWACKKRKQILPFLVRHGASVNALRPDCISPLIVSAALGLCCPISFLLGNGADINYTKGETTALIAACVNNKVEIVNMLLKEGASTDIGRIFLMVATARSTKIEIMKIIFERIDINSEIKNGVTPLTYCVTTNLVDQAKRLLELDANVNLCVKDKYPPLHLATIKENIEMVQLLLDHGANVNLEDNNGRTPLHIAAAKGKTEIVRILLSGGANLNAIDKKGSTPLIAPISEGHKEVFDMLLASGAKINSDDITCDILTLACLCEQEEMIKILIDKGADLEKSIGILLCLDRLPKFFGLIAEKCEKEFLVSCLAEKGLDEVVSDALKAIIRKK